MDLLVGDAAKAHEQLGWKCEVDFFGLVEMIVAADVDALSQSGAHDPEGEDTSFKLRDTVSMVDNFP